MNISEHDIDLIEKALMDRLDAQESLRFEEKMKEAPFAERFHQEKAIYEQIQDEGKNRLKDTLRVYESSLKRLPHRHRAIWIAVAASLLLLAFWVLPHLLKNPSEQLFAAYYNPLPNLVDPINKSGQDERSPFQLYELGEYREALNQFNQLSDNPNNAFYKALCLLELNGLDQAIQQLTLIAGQSDHPYHREGQWFLALAHLKAKQTQEAKQVLTEIGEDGASFYADKAREILTKLD